MADRIAELLAANNRYQQEARDARAAEKRALEERDRANRNRDMWQGQCERQAAQLAGMRALLARAAPIIERQRDDLFDCYQVAGKIVVKDEGDEAAAHDIAEMDAWLAAARREVQP